MDEIIDLLEDIKEYSGDTRGYDGLYISDRIQKVITMLNIKLKEES